MNVLQIILVLLISFLAGMESVLDEWQFHQPILACTLIGLACGQPAMGIALGGSLQLIALGWMNIGAAMAPDAALCSTASAVLVCMKGVPVSEGIATALLFAVAGLTLTIFARSLTIGLAHAADAAADKNNIRGVEMAHIGALMIQGLRCAIPVALVIAIPADAVTAGLNAIPTWVSGGLSAAGGFIVVVGYAMVINMMATPKLWPFFILGFALAPLTGITLIGMGMIGIFLALVYLQLSPEFNGGGSGPALEGGTGGDALDDILNDYE
ncbi:MAG: PTS mannose/fructose/sorbose transporter subunit IIC [Atopobiaceae bacterium]|jgi:PTS system mannose-specific IIC component|nr:PTS mannose/fructose/sorbose transporter subunit IIC [Atopobiaceae bacterium]MCI2173415.1 PTS mannose/fructose/sorbose transporter subunit IIC [Atopobiaceae bacterium]MCI2207410.1 PTS mannose/fructose/sorbose transporter subunit IIC [Atopobiaceae bacterium]